MTEERTTRATPDSPMNSVMTRVLSVYAAGKRRGAATEERGGAAPALHRAPNVNGARHDLAAGPAYPNASR